MAVKSARGLVCVCPMIRVTESMSFFLHNVPGSTGREREKKRGGSATTLRNESNVVYERTEGFAKRDQAKKMHCDSQ